MLTYAAVLCCRLTSSSFTRSHPCLSLFPSLSGSHDFYNKTGTSREKVHFCRELDEKADVCKELGVTGAHFTCFISIKAHILTPAELRDSASRVDGLVRSLARQRR
jgi:hypothetical protein